MNLKPFAMIGLVALVMAGCTATNKSMREPNTRLELELDDFEISEQVTGEATSTKIIGIDWQRLTNQTTGTVAGGSSLFISIANIPVMGNFVYDMTSNYALYEMMVANPDYDVVLYPQFETVVERPILGIGFFKKTTTVKATARLGKLKSEDVD